MREREEEEPKARNGMFGGERNPRPEYHSNAGGGRAVPSRTNHYNAWNNSYEDYNYHHRNAGVIPKWGFKDAEMKRQRRVVRYKTYAVEGKMKASVRSGFCWIKNKYRELVYGY